MTSYLYRVRITKYPDNAAEAIYDTETDQIYGWKPVQGWAPLGWKPDGNYIKMLGTTEFVWPSTKKVYRSRSTAKTRAELIESFGATVVIERSKSVVWPDAPVDVNGTWLADQRDGLARGVADGSLSMADVARRLLDDAKQVEAAHAAHVAEIRAQFTELHSGRYWRANLGMILSRRAMTASKEMTTG